MADETDQFLRSLYERAKQDGEDPEEVAKRIYQNNRGVSRRELMQGGGALGLGAAMGGGGAMAATGQASADASTSDSDGNVGTPSDRVDVFADGVDSASIDTDKEAITGGAGPLAIYRDSNGHTTRENFSTIQAAVDFIESNGSAGDIFIPPKRNSGDYSENVLIDGAKAGVFAGGGIRTKIAGDGSSPALRVASTAGDWEIRDIWIDYVGSGTQYAVDIDAPSISMRNVDIDDAGEDYALVVTGERFTSKDLQLVQTSASVAEAALHGNHGDIQMHSKLASNRVFSLKGDYNKVACRADNPALAPVIESGSTQNQVAAIVENSSGRAFRCEGSDNTIWLDATASTNNGSLAFANSAIDNTLYVNVDGGLNIGNGNDDNVIYGTFGSVSDSANRTVINGWGTNDGDPSSTGEWNGNGRQGVMVRDTTNGNNYVYVNGSWVTL